MVHRAGEAFGVLRDVLLHNLAVQGFRFEYDASVWICPGWFLNSECIYPTLLEHVRGLPATTHLPPGHSIYRFEFGMCFSDLSRL